MMSPLNHFSIQGGDSHQDCGDKGRQAQDDLTRYGRAMRHYIGYMETTVNASSDSVYTIDDFFPINFCLITNRVSN